MTNINVLFVGPKCSNVTVISREYALAYSTLSGIGCYFDVTNLFHRRYEMTHDSYCDYMTYIVRPTCYNCTILSREYKLVHTIFR